MTTPQKEQIRLAIELIQLLAEAVRRAGSIPSGHLYARIMDTVSLEVYERAIGVLLGAGLVAKHHDLLTWAGPLKETV